MKYLILSYIALIAVILSLQLNIFLSLSIIILYLEIMNMSYLGGK